MLFTTLQFCFFVAACVLLYYLAPARWRWVVLLGASLVFYATLGRRRIAFLLISCVVTWLGGLVMQRINDTEKASLKKGKGTLTREERKRLKQGFTTRRRVVLVLFLLVVVGMLLTFKFYNLAADTFAILPGINLLMPVGISFYTLQVSGYMIDLYGKKVQAERNLLKVTLFTTFFPQIIQGPISRFSQLEGQLYAPHSFDYNNVVLGLERILWGYFKKLVIADRIAVMTRTLYGGYEEYAGFYIAVAAVLYTIQLYADFSGGIDIALGVGQLFGITLPENFQRPLFSKSITEFWRRWHMTLGSWLRDYIFYPLTFCKPLARFGRWLNKHKLKWAAKWVPTYIALFITWFISGVWHGEGLQYICNGLWHGILIMIGTTIAKPSERFFARHGIAEQSFGLRAFRVTRTFICIAIGEIMFGASSFAMMMGMFRNLFSAWNPQMLFDGSLLQLGLDMPDLIVGALAVLVLFCASLASRQRSLREWINTRPLPLRWGILLGGMAAVMLFGIYGPAYDPTPFIYFQF